MPIDPGLIGPTTMAVTQGVGAFTTFLPPISEIRRTNPADNPDFAADVRMGEVAAVTTTVGIGAIATSLTGNNAPIVVACVVSLALVVLYESTLRGERPMQPKIVFPALATPEMDGA